MKELLTDPERMRSLFLQASIFGMIAAVWYAGVTFWYLRRSRRKQQVHQRLNVGDNTPQEQRVLRLWRDGRLAGETHVSTDGQFGLLERLEQLRMDAGWTTPFMHTLTLLCLAAAVAFVASWLLLGNILLGASLVAVIFMVFRAYLHHCISKRSALFEKQLVDALDLSARSLRAGHPLSGAFQLIANEVQAPVGMVFAEIAGQESLGVSIQDALRNAADRSRSPDMRIFAASVIIQLRSGGNLAEMMERVANVVRERMRLSRRARVLTAEAQLSKWVLLALPIGLFAFLNIVNSPYMQPFYTHPFGRIMLIGAAVGMIVGGWVMGRMAVLKY